MDKLCVLFLLSGLIPLVRALFANRKTTLRSTMLWAILAWLAWVIDSQFKSIPYATLCLTACVGVSVLGARQPGAKGWNFVVLSLLVILLWPLAEGLGELRIGLGHLLFLGALLFLLVINYLPTRLGPAAILLGAICAFELVGLNKTAEAARLGDAFAVALGLVPWLAWFCCWLRPINLPEVDRKWLQFRDSYGLMWAQRQREQFNRSAANAGWSVRLGWGGLQRDSEAPPPFDSTLLALLSAVLKRFETLDDDSATPHQKPPGPPPPALPIPGDLPLPGPPLPSSDLL